METRVSRGGSMVLSYFLWLKFKKLKKSAADSPNSANMNGGGLKKITPNSVVLLQEDLKTIKVIQIFAKTQVHDHQEWEKYKLAHERTPNINNCMAP